MNCSLKQIFVRFLTKIQDWIKNPDHYDFSSRKETMYPRKDYFSFISIETTHDIFVIITLLLTMSQVC